MGSQGLFNKTISILEQSLDLRSLKHNLLVTNIANKDTPNYKAFDMAVEDEMHKLTGQGTKLSMKRTDDGHLNVGTEGQYSDVTITQSSGGLLKSRDGNTVDIEKQMGSLAENNLVYNAMAQIIKQKLQGLKSAIQGGSK